MVANLEVRLDDKSNFPLVKVPPLNAWVQWLPVTKIQIEYFLTAFQDSAYDAAWYADILKNNPRVSPDGIREDNYFNAIATNVLPEDCRRFAGWMGRGYRLLTTDEWVALYKFAMAYDADDGIMDKVTAGTRPRIHKLLNNVEQAAAAHHQATRPEPRKLAQQMLLTAGVVEYVFSDKSGNRFGGHGVAHKKLQASMAMPDMIQPIADSTRGVRMKHFGFRLMKKGQ